MYRCSKQPSCPAVEETSLNEDVRQVFVSGLPSFFRGHECKLSMLYSTGQYRVKGKDCQCSKKSVAWRKAV